MSSLPARTKKNSQEKVETLGFSSFLPWKQVVGSGRISNSSKLSCVLSLPASMKRMRSRTSEKELRHRFSLYKPMGIFFRRSRAANSAVVGPIRPKFKLIRALMYIIIACKYEKDRIKNSREKVETPFSPLQPYGSFGRRRRTDAGPWVYYKLTYGPSAQVS